MKKKILGRVFSVFLVLSVTFAQSGGFAPGLYYQARADEVIYEITSPDDNFVTDEDTIDVIYTVNGEEKQDSEPLFEGENTITRGDKSVNVICDMTAPVITILEDVVDVPIGDIYDDVKILEGVTAEDSREGDLTESIVTVIKDSEDNETDTIDTAAIGEYTITYNVTDYAGNPADEVTRTVNVINNEDDGEDGEDGNDEEEDTQIPIITLLGSNPVDVYVGDSYEDAGATAVDEIDGDLTENIKTEGKEIDTAAVGTYTITYDVSDDAGNEADQKTRTVNVIVRPSSGGGGGILIAKKFVPQNVSVLINNGHENTANRNVGLDLVADGATMMAIANDSDFNDSSWETFSKDKEWTLGSGVGEKTVYVKFKNASGRESDVYTDTITGTSIRDHDNHNEQLLDIHGPDLGGAGGYGQIFGNSFNGIYGGYGRLLGDSIIGGHSGYGRVLGNSIGGIYDGDIIQCINSANPDALYVVKIVGPYRYIRRILRPDFFRYYRHFDQTYFKQVASLDGYITSSWVRVNTGVGGGARITDRVYEINGDGTKHWLRMTTKQFYSVGGYEGAIYSINKWELSSYTTGDSVIFR